MKIGTVTTGSGVVTTLKLTWLPQMISFAAGTQFTALKVTSLGDGVVCDLDSDGLNAVGVTNRVTADTGITTIPLANGIVLGKNVEIQITNSAAQTPDIFGVSQRKNGNMYVRTTQQQVFANSGIELKTFLTLMLPNFVEDDELNIFYKNGLSQKFAPEDLRAVNSFENQINDDDFDFYIANIKGRIDSVNYIPDADQQVYFQTLRRIADLKY